MLKQLLRSPSFMLGCLLFFGTLLCALLAPLLFTLDVERRVGLAYTAPSAAHWLGTDHLGIDMLSLLLAGLRASLYVGLLAGSVATVLGTLIGLYGGYKGGLVDDLLTSATNLFLVIPTLIVLILLSSSLEEGRSLTLIALLIGCTTWTWTARAVRAQSASLRARDHVALARINGFGTGHIVVFHIMPYLLSYIFMVFILQTASGILTEASLKEMWSPVKLADGSIHRYGFGWELYDIAGRRQIGHGGSLPGFRSAYARFPDDGLTVILLTNADDVDRGGILAGIAKLYLPVALTK